ncbi:MAG: hypothetical protein CMJ31_12120 [Phycisphaerae bacterium]|nr:hypothetical protein [Phycisphaerae bacterium]
MRFPCCARVFSAPSFAILLAIPASAGPLASDAHRDATPSDIRDPNVIYGDDDRVEAWEVDDVSLAPLLGAACVVVDQSELTYSAINDAYQLATRPWTHVNGLPICSNERFFGQPTVGDCSAFLVARDLVVTAGHCIAPFEPRAFVFGFAVDGSSGAAPAQASFDDVYFAEEVIARSTGEVDYAVVRLDRPVVGRAPAPIRRTGAPAVGDPIAIIGHPAALPLKYAGGAAVTSASPGAPTFEADVDAYAGNSGSMIVNGATGRVEGVLVRGHADFAFNGACFRSNQLEGDAINAEDCVSVASFAHLIPMPTLGVTAQAARRHDGPAGGPFTPGDMAYTLSNPSEHPIRWRAKIEGASVLSITTPPSGTLLPGEMTTLSASVNGVASTLGAGFAESSVVISDITNDTGPSFHHTIEIGRFGVERATPMAIPDPGATSIYLSVPTEATIADLDVDLRVEHTWIGDLSVRLTSPAGTSVVLHNRSGGSRDDIDARYDDASNPPAGGLLASFNGEQAKGLWRVDVTDHARRDTGRLLRVALRVLDERETPIVADLAAPRGVVDVADVSTFLALFGTGDMRADYASPYGTLDIADIVAYLGYFGAGL